jgi:hypothetical protein
MPELVTGIPDVEDCKFDVDAGDEPEEVELRTAIIQAAYEVGLLEYVMVEPVIGHAI